jgi:hypothetical protein
MPPTHPPTNAQGPGTLEIDQIAPNYALRELLEAWIATNAATGATDTRDMD